MSSGQVDSRAEWSDVRRPTIFSSESFPGQNIKIPVPNTVATGVRYLNVPLPLRLEPLNRCGSKLDLQVKNGTVQQLCGCREKFLLGLQLQLHSHFLKLLSRNGRIHGKLRDNCKATGNSDFKSIARFIYLELPVLLPYPFLFGIKVW